MEIHLTFPEFKALVRLVVAEVAAYLPANIPISVDDSLMDVVGEIAIEAWYVIKGSFPNE